MRTSYQPSFSDGADEENNEHNSSYISMLLISAYYDLHKAVCEENKDKETERYVQDFESGHDKSVGAKATLNKSSIEEDEDDDSNSGVRKALMVAIPLTFILIVTICGLFTWKVLSERVSESTIEALQGKIDKLYTSSNKDELKSSVNAESLETYYEYLGNIEAKDKKGKNKGDISKVESELNTISAYIEDKGRLDAFGSDSYDLNTDGLLEYVQSIRDNVSTYSVPGLALTISNQCSKIENDYSTFINLRQELENITDYENFSSKKYKSRVDKISHTPNKEELQKMIKGLNSSKKKVLDKKKAEEAAKKKAEEEAKKALEKAEAERKEAEKALQEQERKAQEEARKKEEEIRKLEERQKELEEQQKRLEEQQREEDEEDTPTPSPVSASDDKSSADE